MATAGSLHRAITRRASPRSFTADRLGASGPGAAAAVLAASAARAADAMAEPGAYAASL